MFSCATYPICDMLYKKTCETYKIVYRAIYIYLCNYIYICICEGARVTCINFGARSIYNGMKGAESRGRGHHMKGTPTCLLFSCHQPSSFVSEQAYHQQVISWCQTKFPLRKSKRFGSPATACPSQTKTASEGGS